MKSKFIASGLIFVACIAVYSCTHVSGTYISTNGSMASGSMKDNCMECHQTGATEGGFIVAGTVLAADSVNKSPNGTVYLHTLANGKDSLNQDGSIFLKDSIIATIEVDGVGNFYTTHPIDLHKGVYPSVTSSSGNTTFMEGLTANGACNSCHGVSVGKIVVR